MTNRFTTAAQAFHDAVHNHRQGRLVEAEQLYRAVLKSDPNHFGALHYLGTIRSLRGQHDDAARLIRKALNQKPNAAEAHNSLGVVLLAQGRPREAILRFERALALRPGLSEAHGNLANALVAMERPEEAVAHYTTALAADPHSVEARNNLGNALLILNRLAEAIACYERVLAARPDHARAHNNIATALRALNRHEEAAIHYERSLAILPDDGQTQLNFGMCLFDQGRVGEARDAYRRAAALQPRRSLPKWLSCMSNLPLIYRSEQEIEDRRASYGEALEELEREYRAADQHALAEAADAVGAAQPFFLPYQGRCDRELQRAYGAMVARLMAARFPDLAQRPKIPGDAGSAPIRVGVLSAFFRDHSNWKIPIRGWVENLPRERFQLYGYHTTGARDAETEAARGMLAKFVQGPLSFESWCQVIREDRLHILVVPEIGMDAMTAKLASLRLAPVQATSWGQPTTSGLPTIDCFLSSDLMEPPDGQAHYTEELVRLPNIGIWCEPPASERPLVRREELGFSSGDVIYWSCQTLYKYLPRNDWIFPAIAAAVPRARFLFIRHSHAGVTAIFRERLAAAFAAQGLLADRYCSFVDRLSPARFSAISGATDVFLDTPGWSGCNSALEAAAADLPIVTHRGDLMRARHSAGILEMIGMKEAIADTVEGFVAIAIALGRDADHRQHMRERLARSKEAVYRDGAAIRGLEDFIVKAVATDRYATPPGR